MSGHTLSLGITEASQIGEARRHIRRIAGEIGLEAETQEKAAIIGTELATNLSRYAKSGELHIRTSDSSGRVWLEVVSLDRGPGMANVDRCMEDGFSTGGTPGNGLGAARRLATDFDIYSSQPDGTVVFCRVSETKIDNSPSLKWGVICRPAPGETLSGDAWSFVEQEGAFALMIVDGLGHGPLAAEAADAGINAFEESPFGLLSQIFQRADLRMRGGRGGAAAAAQFDRQTRTLKYVGVGNIAGHLRANGEDKGRGLLSHNGTLGVQVRKIQEMEYPCPERGLLVMHSDGLQSRWSLERYPGLQRQHPAVIAAVLYRDFTRGRDDVTVAVVQISVASRN